MLTVLDKSYRKEKLLEWERKSLTEKYSMFSLSKQSTWITLGLIVLILSLFGFIFLFIPPRYGWGNWTPPNTSEEYQYRLSNFLITIPIFILVVFIYVNIRNKIDLTLGIKRTANFKVTHALNLLSIKILLLNGWRPFIIKSRKPFFDNAIQGQIITIKRSGTYRLIDYYIRDEKAYNLEPKMRQAYR